MSTLNEVTSLPFAQALAQSRSQAPQSGRALVELLQEALQLEDEDFSAVLGQQLELPVLSMAALHLLEAAIERLPFGEMLRRECLLLQNQQGQLRLVLSDPL